MDHHYFYTKRQYKFSEWLSVCPGSRAGGSKGFGDAHGDFNEKFGHAYTGCYTPNSIASNIIDKNEVSQIATCTPHIGASTDQASEATAEEVVRIVKSYKDTGTPLNTVNIRKKSSATTSLVVRHFNHVGVLAGVLDELRAGEINIEEMENTIFEGDKAASCILKLDSEPPKKLLDKISKGEFIISAFPS